MLGDAGARVGGSAGIFYKPAPDLQVRAGLRLGTDLANFDAISHPLRGLRDSLDPSAYGDVAYRRDGLVMRATVNVPLLAPDTYQVTAAVAYSPVRQCSVGVAYSHQQMLSDSTHIVKVGGGCLVAPGVSVTAGANMTATTGTSPQVAAYTGFRLDL